MECPKCHSQIEDWSKFCNHCGTKIEVPRKCSKCGFLNPGDSNFCTECGNRLVFPTRKSVHKSENVTQKQSIEVNEQADKSVLAQESFNIHGVRFTMIRVEGGTFTMGATPEQHDPGNDEMPTHRVTLSSYMIGQTEVTQELWEEVMGSNPSEFKSSTNPVETVSWHNCQDFIRRLNSLTGRSFRLPTEAEWEYAARGGNKSKGYQYSGSNKLDDVAWYGQNSGKKTHPVATKAPNELGLYDMSGNVWEWCQDWYGIYSSDAQTNPTGCKSGQRPVTRGGGWNSTASSCRTSFRYGGDPDLRGNYRGLRLVLSE